MSDEYGGEQAAPPPPPPADYGEPAEATGPSMDPLAIVSLVVGVLGIPVTCCCCQLFGFVAGILALGLGGFSMKRINDEPEKYSGKGLAIAGMVLGGLLLLLAVAWIIYIIVTVGVSGLTSPPDFGGGDFGDFDF